MTDDATQSHKMPLLDHLIELRTRLLYSVIALFVCFLVAFYFAEEIFRFLSLPLADAMEDQGIAAERQRMIFTGLLEVFITYIKVAFFTAAFVSCPIFLTQIWLFIAPGLYRNEKKALGPFLAATPILFFIGGALVYFVIFPFATEFLLAFDVQTVEGGGGLPIQLEAKVDQYLSLLMRLIFAFGLCFQLPVIMTLLARVGIATSEGMAAKRKYAILATFVVAAVLTPPDPISQLSLAIPIVVLYEISIWMAKLVEKKRAQAAEDDDEEDGGEVTAT